MSNVINVCFCLSLILLNQFNTAAVFFHWLMLVRSMIFLFMRSNICLLILPISDFVGLMRRHVGLLSKLGLWSLRVIKASLFAVILILSSRASGYSFNGYRFSFSFGGHDAVWVCFPI